jgi:hypothetical protein
MRRFVIFTPAFVIFVFAVFILYLEEGSRSHYCEVGTCAPPPKVCNPDHYPINNNVINEIARLVDMKSSGIEPDRGELMHAVILAPYSDMIGANGVYCNGMIFVRENLGAAGQAFVARHELSHAFQSAHVEGDCSTNYENCATLIAAGQFPVGFVETVISSLALSYKETKDKQCFLFGSWKIFRYYILP